jgi:signal transduction histidine kinase
MVCGMALHLALGLAFLGSILLAGVLARYATRVAGAPLLVLFLIGVATWILGNELPALFGPGAERLGLAMVATAPLTSAVFFHFAVLFTGTALPLGALAASYALGGGMAVLAMAFRPGTFAPFAGLPFVATPNAVGWAASLVWGGLALAGLAVLLRAAWFSPGLVRRQALAVAAASGWGAACMAGYAVAALQLDLYPWPLLGLPLYPLILVYGVLRYQVLVANAWARRALAWTLLVAVGAVVVGLASLVPVLAELGPVASGAVAALSFLALGGPARWLAQRMVYPGGVVTDQDLADWRAALSRCETPEALAEAGAGLIEARLRVPVAVRFDAAPEDPAQPWLCLTLAPTGAWQATLEGWDAAPPGPRQLAMVLGALMAEERARLGRAAAMAVAEREQAQAARLAELGALAATVAHDIRNPLNIIAMAAATAPAEARAEIREQIGRVTRLANELLDYAKPWVLAPVPFDLADLARVATHGASAVTLGDGLAMPCPVLADPGRLRQALTNLLDNALVAPGATRVLLELERAADGAPRLLVADDGDGVPDDLRGTLFQPFISRTPGGTGLGLAIVAKVMQAHGGTATLEGRPGWTSCFVLALPASVLGEARG